MSYKLTLQEVKDYLRIPYDDEDNLLKSLIEAGYLYLEEAIDEFWSCYLSESFQKKTDLWILTMWMPAAYEIREGAFAHPPEMGYAARALLTQLQLYRKE
jgi:uncharacterized phage protein (predicted DNA packaging)